MKKKSFLASDYDGVLGNGYGGIEFLRYLTEKNLFPEKSFNKLIKGYEDYKKGMHDYNKMMSIATEAYCEGLAGKRVDDVEQEAEAFFEKHKKEIYPHTREIMDIFRDDVKIIISGSSQEIMKRVGKEIGADMVFASKIEHNGIVYYDKMTRDMSIPGQKAATLAGCIYEHDLKEEGSFGLGDTEHDEKMMFLTEYPIAVNPNDNLRKIALDNKWITANNDTIVEKIKSIKK